METAFSVASASASTSRSVVIKREGRPHGAGDAEARHQRLAAMVAGADGDAHLVHQRAEIVVVDALDIEGKRARPVGRAVETDPGNRRQRVGGGADEALFMLLDRAQADAVHEIEGGSEGDGALDVRRAGFELERQLVVGGFFESDFLDHLAAAAPWRQGVENFRAAPEHADAGRGVDLVAGKREEIDAERLHVDADVGDGLRGVDQHERPGVFRGAGHFRDRIDGAEGVGNPGEREDFRALVEQGKERVLVQRAVLVAGNHLENRAGALAEHLPRNDVGMVLQRGNEDFIARLDPAGKPEDVGDEIDAIGGAGGEDHLVRSGGIEVGGDRLAGFFKGLGGEAGEMVGAAVDVGIDRLVVVPGRQQHRHRLLGGGRIVQINQEAGPGSIGRGSGIQESANRLEHGENFRGRRGRARLEHGGPRRNAGFPRPKTSALAVRGMRGLNPRPTSMYLLKKVIQLREHSHPDHEKPFLEHLEDLRTMITRVVITLVISMIICFAFNNRIMEFFRHPVDQVLVTQLEATLPDRRPAPADRGNLGKGPQGRARGDEPHAPNNARFSINPSATKTSPSKRSPSACCAPPWRCRRKNARGSSTRSTTRRAQAPGQSAPQDQAEHRQRRPGEPEDDVRAQADRGLHALHEAFLRRGHRRFRFRCCCYSSCSSCCRDCTAMRSA